MDELTKKKWVEALRSGKYKQGKGFLRPDHNSFCCLGVLADVVGCKWECDDTFGKTVYHIAGHPVYVGAIPSQIADGIGIKYQCEFANMNDGGATFEEIAEWIEEYC